MEIVISTQKALGAIPHGWVKIDLREDPSNSSWGRNLSLTHMGPVQLWNGVIAKKLLNAWEISKIYPDLLTQEGLPNIDYWRWAAWGWKESELIPPRNGKGAEPVKYWWDCHEVDPKEAKGDILFPMYRDTVRRLPGYSRLVEIAERSPVVLMDQHGYDHESTEETLREAILNPQRLFSTALALKAMLLYGDHVDLECIE